MDNHKTIELYAGGTFHDFATECSRRAGNYGTTPLMYAAYDIERKLDIIAAKLDRLTQAVFMDGHDETHDTDMDSIDRKAVHRLHSIASKALKPSGAHALTHDEAVHTIATFIAGVAELEDKDTAASKFLDKLSKNAPDDVTRAAIDAAELIMDGEDGGDPADTIREQVCSWTGYADDGKTDEMLMSILMDKAKNAPDAETTAVVAAVRAVMAGEE